jgi:hypothetical protein
MQGFVNDLIREYECEGRAATPANNNLFNISSKALYLGKRIRPDILYESDKGYRRG